GGRGGGAQADRGVETDTPQATAGDRGDQGRAGAGQDQCVTDRLPADQLGVLGTEFQLLVERVPGMAGDRHQAVLGGLVDRVGGLDAYDQGADEPALLFEDALERVVEVRGEVVRRVALPVAQAPGELPEVGVHVILEPLVHLRQRLDHPALPRPWPQPGERPDAGLKDSSSAVAHSSASVARACSCLLTSSCLESFQKVRKESRPGISYLRVNGSVVPRVTVTWVVPGPIG